MHTLYKKIENLEKAAVPVLRARQRIAERALHAVSDLESLISAFGADREGRSLTESESASRQAYSSAFEREFREQLLRGPVESERIPGLYVIHCAMIRALVRCFSDSGQIELAAAGKKAEMHGRAPTQPELDAMQKFDSESGRLYQLAGFRSETEFEMYWAQGGK